MNSDISHAKNWSNFKNFLRNFLVPVEGIPDAKKLFYARTVAWMLWFVGVPLGIFSVVFDEYIVPGGVPAHQTFIQHFFGLVVPYSLAVLSTYTLPTEKIHYFLAVFLFGSCFASILLVNVADGGFLPVFLPLAACMMLPFACIMPMYPKQVMVYIFIFFSVAIVANLSGIPQEQDLLVSWITFWLLCGAGAVFAIMLRVIFDDMALALKSQKTQIDELTETNALLNITLNENQFGLVGYNRAGELVLERGASLDRICNSERNAVNYNNLDNISRFFETQIHSDFAEILNNFREIKIDSEYYVIRAYDLANLTIISHMDVTSMRQVEEELRAHQKLSAIGEITSGVAHNYNNTLAIALSNLEAIPKDENELLWREYISPSIYAIEQSADISRKLLVLAGRQNLSLEVFDVNIAFDKMQNLIISALGSEIALELNCAKNLFIRTDRREFETAILNLIINSRYAIQSSQGKVSIIADQRDSYVRVRVSDNGHGIDPKIQSKIFDPFFSTKKSPLASGLGLSTVRGFVQQSHGFVKMNSSKSGTNIDLYFPACAPDQMAPKDQPKDMNSHKNLVKEHLVLLVDDNVNVLKSYARLLNTMGYETITETSPIRSLELYNNNPDISHVFLDLSMPEMDGIALGQLLMDMRNCPYFYLLTGETSKERYQEAMRVGFEEIFIKPIRAQDLRQILERDCIQSDKSTISA